MDEVPAARARAYAPSHVTGIVVPRVDARDPRARGSLGAGIVLNVGVTATASWAPAARPSVRVVSNVGGRLPISVDVARRLLPRRPGRLVVRLRHELPVGYGFGSSASGALATSLAVAGVVGAARRRAIEVAHLADLYGQGGLGGVAAVLGGGLELRLAPGIPPFGRAVRIAWHGPVAVGTVGRPIPTRSLLSDPAWLRRLGRARRYYDRLSDDRTPEGFWSASEQFTDALGLASPRLRTVLRGLRRRGARAAQAMFGESFLASIPPGTAGEACRDWLLERHIDLHEGPPARRGARRLRT